MLVRFTDLQGYSSGADTKRHQRSDITDLALKALKTENFADFIHEAVSLATKTLKTELGGFLELLPDGESLLLRAGVGWNHNWVGNVIGLTDGFSPGPSSMPHDNSFDPIRCLPEEFQEDHHIVSGISVIVEGEARPLGVLAVYTALMRTFEPQEKEYLRDIARLLGAVAAQYRNEDEETRSEDWKHPCWGVGGLETYAEKVASHFNNLLTNILNHASLALAEMSPYKPVRKRVQQIESIALMGRDTTNQLFTFAGKKKAILLPTNLNDLVEQMNNLGWLVPKHVRIDYDLQYDLPYINADAQQIRKLIINLVTNACDAIGDENGVITIATGLETVSGPFAEQTYSKESLAEGHRVYLELKDSGCGMDKATRFRLFHPFFTTKPQGRGLGMAEVLGIVRGHGGAITVDSTPGQGTTIRIVLPLATENRKQIVPPPVNPIFRGKQH